MTLRDTLREKPWIGWSLAALLLVVAGLLVFRGVASSTSADLGSDILIRYADTGAEARVNRGLFEKVMLDRAAAGTLKATEGHINPATKKPTGFPVNEAYWTTLVKELSDEVGFRRRPPKGGPAGGS